MNHAGNKLVLTNTGHRRAPARLPGPRPGGRRSPDTAHEGTVGFHLVRVQSGVSTLALAPGGQAQAVLSWTHTGSGAGDASYLEITPPASTTHLTLPFKQQVDSGTVQVTALSTNVPLRG